MRNSRSAGWWILSLECFKFAEDIGSKDVLHSFPLFDIVRVIRSPPIIINIRRRLCLLLRNNLSGGLLQRKFE